MTVDRTEGALVVSAAELATGKFFIKSDIYRGEDGSLFWTATHPPSGWTARGTGETVEAVQDEIEAAFSAAVQDAEGDTLGPGKRVNREAVNGINWRALSDHDMDDLVDAWHTGAGPDQSLAEFLGMTDEEYALWVRNPTAARMSSP